MSRASHGTLAQRREHKGAAKSSGAKKNNAKGDPEAGGDVGQAEAKYYSSSAMTDSDGEGADDSPLSKALQQLSEKASATRIEGATKLGQLMLATSTDALAEWLDGRVESVADSLVRCVNKGMAPEVRAAAGALQVLMAYDTETSEFVMSSKVDPMLAALKKSTTPTASRAAIASLVGVLGLAYFIAGQNPAVPEVLLLDLEAGLDASLRSKAAGEPEVTREVCRAWAALASCFPLKLRAGALHERMLNTLAGFLLDGVDVAARAAAAEAMAMLVESRQAAKAEGVEPDYGTTGASKASQRSLGHADLLAKIQSLLDGMTQASVRVEKKALSKSLDDVMATLEAKVAPEQSFTVLGGKLNVEGWDVIPPIR